MKDKIIKWLTNNGVDLTGKKMRLINYRGVPELRVYKQPMEFLNSKKSRRMWKEADENGHNCTYGIHSRKITMYSHLSEKDIERAEKDADEKEFLLMQFNEGF